MGVPVSAQTLPEFLARLSRLLSRIGHWKLECRPNRLLVTDRPGRLWPWSAKLRMQPPPSSQLLSTVTLAAESCRAALGSLELDRSMVLWRRVSPETPSKAWMPSLWVAPPPWLG